MSKDNIISVRVDDRQEKKIEDLADHIDGSKPEAIRRCIDYTLLMHDPDTQDMLDSPEMDMLRKTLDLGNYIADVNDENVQESTS